MLVLKTIPVVRTVVLQVGKEFTPLTNIAQRLDNVMAMLVDNNFILVATKMYVRVRVVTIILIRFLILLRIMNWVVVRQHHPLTVII